MKSHLPRKSVETVYIYLRRKDYIGMTGNCLDSMEFELSD